MSIEAFIWDYRNGEPIGFDFETVREILSTENTEWSDEFGCLRVRFADSDDCVDIYLGEDAPTSNHVGEIMVSRPIIHPDYLERIFRVMSLGDVMLFYTDETTPVFIRGSDSKQYPADLLKVQGTPRYVQLPSELIHQT